METNLHKLKSESFEFEAIDSPHYRQKIVSLMYLVYTCPNIGYATIPLGQLMCEPKKINLMAAKCILRYLRGTIGLGLKYDHVKL